MDDRVEVTKGTDSFLAAKKEIYDKWNVTGLLKGIDDEHTAIQVAVLMENQRLMNAADTKADHDRVKMFRRTSIPIIRRVYGSWCRIDVSSRFAAYFKLLVHLGDDEIRHIESCICKEAGFFVHDHGELFGFCDCL